MKMICFCQGDQEVIALMTFGGPGRHHLNTRCERCGSTYEYRNWTFSEADVEILTRLEERTNL